MNRPFGQVAVVCVAMAMAAAARATHAPDSADDPTQRLRALTAQVHALGERRHYEEAFQRLAQLQELLPQVRDRLARFAAQAEATLWLGASGQTDTAVAYARDMIRQPPPGETACQGTQYLVRALREGGRLDRVDPAYLEAMAACESHGQPARADAMRLDIASFYLMHDQPADAISLLAARRDAVHAGRDTDLSAGFDATLASAYLRLGDLPNARHFALSAVEGDGQGAVSEARRSAYNTLYQLEQRQNNAAAALAYHERFMQADKAWLDDVSARSLAFQVVDQQVTARKADVDALNRKNEILRLSSALDHKEVENGRLYIAVLVMVLAGIVWLVLHLRRSQLRFMRMARRDGLTGICNREHFVEQSERVLAYGARSDRGACLILFDLDHFKQVNDTYGHSAGDDVLRRAVDVCRRALHACDVFGRLGGEEFAVLLPDCSPAQARARAEQLRLSISATSATPARPTLTVTASFGVASTLQCGFEMHRLLAVADGALYRAKRSGRNAVFMGDTGDIPDSPYPALSV